MRRETLWLLGAVLALPFVLGTTARAQEEGWDDEAAAREKKMRERAEMERREREEMERHRREGEGGPKEPGGPWGPPRPMKKLSEDEVNAVVEWLKEWDPGRLEKVNMQKSENPEFFMNLIQDAYHEKHKMEFMKTQDPGRYEDMMKERKLDRQCQELAAKYRKTEDETQKTAVKTELQVLLGQLFDVREAGREKEVKELEKRLNELRQMVEKRRTNKMQIVENRLKQMLGEKEYMDW